MTRPPAQLNFSFEMVDELEYSGPNAPASLDSLSRSSDPKGERERERGGEALDTQRCTR